MVLVILVEGMIVFIIDSIMLLVVLVCMCFWCVFLVVWVKVLCMEVMVFLVVSSLLICWLVRNFMWDFGFKKCRKKLWCVVFGFEIVLNLVYVWIGIIEVVIDVDIYFVVL